MASALLEPNPSSLVASNFLVLLLQTPFHKNMIPIDSFKGAYAFLSNDFLCPVYWNKQLFISAWAALIAARYKLKDTELESLLHPATTSSNPPTEETFAALTHEECDEWKSNETTILEQIIRDKFFRSSELSQKLLATKGRPIVWQCSTNTLFGVVHSRGANFLGQILMEIRQDIQSHKDFEMWLLKSMKAQTNLELKPNITIWNNFGNPAKALDDNKRYWTFGSAITSDVVDENDSVSRKHAIIFVDEMAQVAVMDCRSQHGVYVDSRKIPESYIPQYLVQGASLKLGLSPTMYIAQIDSDHVIACLEERRKQVEKDIEDLSSIVSLPEASQLKTKIVVKNLAYKTIREDILKLFEDCGNIENLRFLQPKEATNPHDESFARCGIAFVQFQTEEQAATALVKNGSYLHRRVVQVNYPNFKLTPKTNINDQINENGLQQQDEESNADVWVHDKYIENNYKKKIVKNKLFMDSVAADDNKRNSKNAGYQGVRKLFSNAKNIYNHDDREISTSIKKKSSSSLQQNNAALKAQKNHISAELLDLYDNDNTTSLNHTTYTTSTDYTNSIHDSDKEISEEDILVRNKKRRPDQRLYQVRKKKRPSRRQSSSSFDDSKTLKKRNHKNKKFSDVHETRQKKYH